MDPLRTCSRNGVARWLASQASVCSMRSRNRRWAWSAPGRKRSGTDTRSTSSSGSSDRSKNSGGEVAAELDVLAGAVADHRHRALVVAQAEGVLHHRRRRHPEVVLGVHAVPPPFGCVGPVQVGVEERPQRRPVAEGGGVPRRGRRRSAMSTLSVKASITRPDRASACGHRMISGSGSSGRRSRASPPASGRRLLAVVGGDDHDGVVPLAEPVEAVEQDASWWSTSAIMP